MLLRLLQSIEAHHSKNAFYIQNVFYSYAQLSERAFAVASYLSVHNASKTPVGIISNDAFETYAGIIGILFTGAAYVPIHPSNPKVRNNSIIEQSGIKIVLSAIPDKLTETFIDTGIVKLAFVSELGSNSQITIATIKPDDTAYILFTSGSTGAPKGVPITHKNLEAFLDSFFALGYIIDDRDRFLQMFDITFDLSVISYLAPLLIGACFYTVPFDTVKYTYIYELLEEQQLTFTLMVPSILSYLRPYFSEIELPNLRYSLFCGEALYADITKEWKSCIPNSKVHNVYGPTEATIFCLAYECDEMIKESNGMVCIGKAMKNCATIIVNDNNEVVEKGELCLSGTQVTPGYINNPQINAEAFFDFHGIRYYRTGDLAFIDSDGDIMYAGRKDYQVKVMGGFRVELNEIEYHARRFTNLVGVVAVAIPNNNGISLVYLFLEQFDGSKEDLIIHLKNQMPEYMIPAEIISIAKFPLNVNGKIDRKELGKMTLQQNR